MARLYADATGAIIRYLRTDDEERMVPGSPPGTAHTLEFDGETNVALAADLATSTDPYRLVGTTLTKGGAVQAVAADGEDTALRKQVAAALAELQTYIAASSLTNAQRDAAIRLLCRIARVLIRRFLA